MVYKKLWIVFLAAVVAAAVWLLTPLPGVRSATAEEAPVLVIDAGHGGEDGGAVAADGTLESDINLDIALRLDALAAFWGVDTVMTRTASEIDYPAEAETLSAKKKADQNARVSLINNTSGAILLSIHQNNYPASAPWGIQVFYGGAPGSDTFAAILQANLTAELCPENRRIEARIDDGIYLMRRAECTSALVECGFLSNPSDLEKLESETYRMKLASVMLSSYLQYIRGTML
ncbi:MAG: N-acetylmuramoyl-L-alanine amidase [Oscillospiraceae bacterium]